MMKRLFLEIFRLIWMFIIVNILVACGTGGGVSTNNSVPNNDVNLGNLANGSVLYISAAKYVTANNGYVTGTIGITSDNTPYTGVLSFNIVPSESKQAIDKEILLSTNPSPCVLSSLGLLDVCQIIINGDGASVGKYIITPILTSNGVVQKFNSFVIEVTSSGNNTNNTNNANNANNASLAINLATNGIQIGQTTTARVSLNNFQSGSNLLVQLLSISSPDKVISITPKNCTLSKDNNYCTVYITGKLEGGAEIIAKTTPLSEPQLLASKQIFVNSNPGEISLSLNPRNITKNEVSTVKVTLNKAGSIINNVKIDVASSDSKVATVIGSKSCNIITSEAPDNSCTVQIKGVDIGHTIITATRQDIKSTNALGLLTVARSAFFTTNTYTGNFGGIETSDFACQDDPQAYVYGGVYKSFLTDGVYRVACTSPYCAKDGAAEHKNWVIAPNETYVFHMSPNVSVSRNSNNMGLFLNESGNVTNNLGIDDFPNPSTNNSWNIQFWGGFDSGYTHLLSCEKWMGQNGEGMNGWTENQSVSSENVQKFFILDGENGGLYCNQYARILCVQQ